MANYPAFVLDTDSNGVVSVVTIKNVNCATNAQFPVGQYPEWIDIANTNVVTNYMNAWAQISSSYYPHCSYLFMDEDNLVSYGKVYTDTPTYSASALDWYRTYCGDSSAKFPISPVPFQSYTAKCTTAVTRLSINESDGISTNLLEITTDPEKWARWWEWRRIVMANLLHQYAEAANRRYASDDNWKGVIYFVSPHCAWTEVTGVDMGLISMSPEITWVVMENQRTASYGVDDVHEEEEIILQLTDAKYAISEGTGFGSYAMLHYYRIETNYTFYISWMTQDMSYAAMPAFVSQLIVPYQAFSLVDIPGWTNGYVTNVPAAAQIWNEIRYRDLWEPITNITPGSPLSTNSSLVLTWSAPEDAVGYELDFSADADFSTTNQSIIAPTNAWTNSAFSTAMFWRVRGCYQEYHIATNGVTNSTSTYHGAWFSADDDP